MWTLEMLPLLVCALCRVYWFDAELVFLSSSQKFPMNLANSFTQALRCCPKGLSAQSLWGECSEQSPLLTNKGELVHTLICLGLCMDVACLFYFLSANNLPLSIWNWYKVNRVRYHMLIPICFLADKSEKYKLFVRLLHINASRQLHG